MEEIEKYRNWLKKFNLKKNPFTLEINPELFVGYNKQILNIIKNIEQQQKLILISGPTGSGKTTIISYLVNKNKNFIYLSKPPKKINDLMDISDYFINDLGILRKIFIKKPKKINNLPYFLDIIIKKPKVLFVDEAHEATLEILEWFRVLVDHVKNLTIVFSALPVFEDILTKNLETLKKRITEKIELTALNKNEVEELIKKRIEYVGGKEIGPFSYNVIDYIYSRTGGFPRDILLLCNKLLNLGAEKNVDIIDINLITENKEPKQNDWKIENLKDMPKKQKKIINIIAENEPITPNEITKYFEGYPSEKHALRAVNNLLKRLVEDGYIEREKIGKSYSYKLSPSTRTILIRA